MGAFAAGLSAGGYRRHEPESSVLYGVVAEHLETFLAATRADPGRAGLPRFVERELRKYLACGQLSHGFCRVSCQACGKDRLVALSCKGRGFCPSCGGRRMAETAAHLVDCVLPGVPVRQWVLTLPFRLRFLLAYDPALLAGVRRIFVRGVLALVRALCKRQSAVEGRSGAVCFTQRFDSGLRVNVHFHLLALDGVYARAPSGELSFTELQSPPLADLERLTRRLHRRILRFLRQRGKLPEENAAADGDNPLGELSAHEMCISGAVQGVQVLGSAKGQKAPQLFADLPAEPVEPKQSKRAKKLACRFEGFSLHAGTRVAAGADFALEKLCRYVARPPLANERLSRLPDGRFAYSLKRQWSGGATHVVFTAHALLERLAALVPRPRIPLVTYHGVLAPAASLRPLIVPEPPPPPKAACAHDSPPHAEAPRPKKGTRRRYYSWAELLKRVFSHEILVCPWCGGPCKVLTFLTDPAVVRRILAHLGLSTEPPHVAPARPPPQTEIDFS